MRRSESIVSCCEGGRGRELRASDDLQKLGQERKHTLQKKLGPAKTVIFGYLTGEQ